MAHQGSEDLVVSETVDLIDRLRQVANFSRSPLPADSIAGQLNDLTLIFARNDPDCHLNDLSVTLRVSG